tara:strand:+ start:132 stop:650 length:519 start_codon:yes stop_codon:yes gene_type:complete
MSDATFDGANLHITLPNIGTFDAQKNIYSAWKEWIRQSDNAKYLPAFDTTGGDDVGGGQTVAPYFFCRNDLGWRIKMPSADGEIVVSGNLFPRDASSNLFEQTVGYDAFLRLEVSTRAVVITSDPYSDKIQEINTQVNKLNFNGNYVQADIKEINSSPVYGTGQKNNKWTGN